jgi:hypothetical protein
VMDTWAAKFRPPRSSKMAFEIERLLVSKCHL